jgi:hypothetical protein
MLQIRGKTLTIIEKNEGRADSRPFNLQQKPLVLAENKVDTLKKLIK